MSAHRHDFGGRLTLPGDNRCAENAFRRGYAHAVEQAIGAVSRGASVADLMAWSCDVAAWREGGGEINEPPGCRIER